MDLPEELIDLHQATRLRIVGVLARQRDASMTGLRDALGLTDGNLASHIRRLESNGWVATRNALASGGFQVRIRMTPKGDAAFQDYLRWLQGFLDRHQGEGKIAGGAGASTPEA